MNPKELYEGTTPKLLGAAEGIQIISPQQFIAKSAQGEEPDLTANDPGVLSTLLLKH